MNHIDCVQNVHHITSILYQPSKTVCLFKKSAFDIFDSMKNLLKKPLIRKLIYILAGIILFILLMDQIILPWYVSSPEKEVPNVVGLQEEEALSVLKENNLNPVVSDTTFDENYPKGTIILQNPHAGEIVKEERRVYLYLSGGEPVVNVPNLRGKSVRDAKFSLERIGLILGEVEEVPSNNPKNMIFDQQFVTGTPLKKGDTVDVTVSLGIGYGDITVPDLIGKSLTAAQVILADSSLRIGKINYQRSFSLLPNTILDQYPSKGSKVNSGDAIDLFVTTSAEDETDEPIEEN